MTTASLLLLLSAALHAAWNALIKHDGDARVNSMGVLAVSLAIATGVAVVLPGAAFPDSRAFSWAVVSGLCEGGYFLTLARSLEGAPLGIAYTVSRGGAMLLVWLVSAGFLGETLGPGTLAGVALIGFGLWLVNVSPTGSQLPRLKRLGWPLACAAFIAGYHFMYRQALSLGAQPPALFALSLGIGLPVYVLVSGGTVTRRVVAKFRARPLRLLLGGVVCAASFLIFLWGLSESGAGQALTLRNTSVVFAQLFGFWMGERVRASGWLGVLLVAAGATLVALH